MSSNFFFFSDPAKLQSQGATDAFGPLPPASGNDLFRVTDRHAFSSDAPAIAVCDGILCAQEDLSGTLTLILKPSAAPPFEAPVVAYFVYKGVTKASLLASGGTQILDETDSSATDFTKKIAADWKAQNSGALAGSSAALGLDRDANFEHDDNGTPIKIFTDVDPVERLFRYPHKTVQLPIVAAGDVIGTFQGTGGFEIVLKRLGYQPKLAFARSADNIVAVPSLAGSSWQPDDYDFFAHWHAKERALAYLDPAAYFGAFVQSKLYKVAGGSASKVSGGNIYQEILATFANKNTAWLDIRNNFAYSYNLFGLYDDTLRFVSPSDAAQASDVNFRAGGWPLLKLAAADVPGSKKGSLLRTTLCLPAGLSMAPAVLVSKGFAKTLGPERPEVRVPDIAADDANAGYLTPIRLAFPAATDGGNTVLTASYTRVNLYETIHTDPQAQAPLNVAARDFLDGVFRPRELQFDRDFSGNTMRFDIYPEEVLVDMGIEYGPTYASVIGIAEDATTVNLFAYPCFLLPGLDSRSLSAALPAWADISAADNTDFLTKLASTFRPVQITKETIDSDTLSAQVDTVIVRNRTTPGYNPVTDRNSMPDFCFVVMGKANHQQLVGQISAAAGLGSDFPVFLTVASSQQKTDTTNNVAYLEKGLQATGYGPPSGSTLSIVSAPLTQRVFRNADF